MFNTILVPLDGSSFGEHAIPVALSIARRARARIRLVHVLQPFVDVVPELAVYQGPIEAEARLEKLRYLERVIASMREVVPAVSVDPELIEGDIVSGLREAAADGKADLIVMTTHGRGPLARFWLGSVADQLVREGPVPLLLVHPSEAEPDFRAEPVFREMLLPLDGTPLAEQIVSPAAELARLMQGSCTLFRVVHTDIPEDLSVPSGPVAVASRVRAMTEELKALKKRQRREALAYLEDVAKRIRPLGVAVRTKVILDEKSAKAILDEIAAGTDMVAIETHGYSGLKRLWLGSVADKVIRGAHGPVLVCRPRA